jgi:heme/copper-type cytochrome/quinol oxidase subunit 1
MINNLIVNIFECIVPICVILGMITAIIGYYCEHKKKERLMETFMRMTWVLFLFGFACVFIGLFVIFLRLIF